VTGLSVNSPDWFNNGPAAVISSGRVDVATGTFNSVSNDNPRIYQENLVLPSIAWDHPISSINITWDSGGSNNAQTAIFAVSGMVPEPSSFYLLGAGIMALVMGTRRLRNPSAEASVLGTRVDFTVHSRTLHPCRGRSMCFVEKSVRSRTIVKLVCELNHRAER